MQTAWEKLMRKFFLFSILFIITFSSPATAVVGVKGGVHFSNWYGSDYADELDRVSNLMLGVSFDITAGRVPGGVITINPEVFYVIKGWKDTEILPPYFPPPYAGSEYTTEISMDYLEIPVLFKYSYHAGAGFEPFVLAGPYIGFMLDSPDMDRDSELEQLEAAGRITGDCFESSDFGLIAGAGVDFSYSVFRTTVEARYSVGLSSVVADGSICAGVNPVFLKNNKNRGFSLLAGISF
jgi:hypothetical protein